MGECVRAFFRARRPALTQADGYRLPGLASWMVLMKFVLYAA